MSRKSGNIEVHMLLVAVGRRKDDGLPDGAIGASILCFASGRSEDEAVRETVAVLKTAGLAPIEVEAHGTADELLESGQVTGLEERALMQRALDEEAVVVIEVVPEFQDAARG